jgi:hypothetical protein
VDVLYVVLNVLQPSIRVAVVDKSAVQATQGDGMAQRKTEYQQLMESFAKDEVHVLLFGLAPCPKPKGPDPIDFLSCRGCKYNVRLWFQNRVCSHPTAVRSQEIARERALSPQQPTLL